MVWTSEQTAAHRWPAFVRAIPNRRCGFEKRFIPLDFAIGYMIVNYRESPTWYLNRNALQYLYTVAFGIGIAVVV
jgi:hypothetical protein